MQARGWQSSRGRLADPGIPRYRKPLETTMPEPINPADIAPPLGAYVHGIEIPGGARQIVVSGQVGVLPDGKVANGIEAQLECAWANILSILAAAGMSARDIVKVTTFLTHPDH